MVTIILPVYNGENTLNRAIHSVFQQTYQDWKLILIDDGSKDHTSNLCDQLQENDSRIQVIHHQTNKGVAYCRNIASKQATTEWIAFLDADDQWDPNKLQSQIHLIQSNPSISFTCTATSYINENGRKSSYVLSVPTIIHYEDLLKQNIISNSSVMIRRDIFLSHLMPNQPNLHEDYACWLSILKDGIDCYGVNEPLLLYQISSSSKSGNKLHSAKMHWDTLAYAHVPLVKRIPAFLSYALKNRSKYQQIHQGF